MKRLGYLVATVTAAVFLGAGTVGAQVTPAVTVSPSSGLVDRQAVSVTSVGFLAVSSSGGTFVPGAFECAPVFPPSALYTLETVSGIVGPLLNQHCTELGQFPVTQSAVTSLVVNVSRAFTSPDGNAVACGVAPEDCQIVVIGVDLPLAGLASAPITFEPAPPVEHRVTVNAVGEGSVVSSPPGITCPSTCSANFSDGTEVGLASTASPGSSFVGWSGDCAGTADCNVIADADRSVTATFEPVPPPETAQREIDADGKICVPQKTYFEFDDVEGHRDGSYSGKVEFEAKHAKFRSKKITALGFGGNLGLVIGTGKYNDYAGYRFAAVVVDTGKHSISHDMLAFSVEDARGNTIMTSDRPQNLCRGDIRIHEDHGY